MDENHEFVRYQIEQLRPEIGSFQLIQFQPCDEGDTTCLNTTTGFQMRTLEFKNCTEEVKAELIDYYLSRNKLVGNFAKAAQCIDDDNLFI